MRRPRAETTPRAGGGSDSSSGLSTYSAAAAREAVSRPGYDGSLSSVAQQPLHQALGLTDRELDRIQELLGRGPNDFELAVFSLLWSEHCGYKHSAPLLRRLPSAGERVLQWRG